MYYQLELLYQDKVPVSGVIKLEVITSAFCCRNIWDAKCLIATLICTVSNTGMSKLINWSAILTT